jgi:pantoate kinase
MSRTGAIWGISDRVASDLGDHTLASGAPSRPDIFLSYAREDQTRARDLAAALEQRGLTVFWDREVPPGQTWPSSIGAALANARCVVVAWSSPRTAPWTGTSSG